MQTVSPHLVEGGGAHNGNHVGEIRGAHPTSYHSFVQVLCNYITERHQETQGEDLPFSTVYVRLVKQWEM